MDNFLRRDDKMAIDKEELVAKIKELLKPEVTKISYDTWILPLDIRSIDGDNIVFTTISEFQKDFIENKYRSLIFNTLRYITNKDWTFSVIDLSKEGQNGEDELVIKDNANANSAEIETNKSTLNPKYTVETFVVGNSNRFAHAAALAVGNEPGKAYNPLFLYGPSGVGKTHLINAIGTRIKELYPEKRVLYVSAHLFQVQYTDSVRTNHFNDFVKFYQKIDVLIIDDIQEFAGVSKTQNTFFHIFNHLHQNGKQLILTSDRAPIMLQGMEDRLLTRFKWGLVAELEKPDIELRKNILRDKIHRDGLIIPDSVICYIAENVNESVRELEGIINSLLVYSIQLKREINLELAQRIVRKAVNCTEIKPLTIDSIINKVCNYYHIDTSTIHTKTRKREVVQVRQVAMYLAKKYTDISSSKIGQLIGNKDHATVLHACKIIKDQVEINKTFKNEIEEIESSLHTQ